MEIVFACGLIALTSWVAYRFGRKSGIRRRSLAAAFSEMLEYVGTFVVFLGLNVVIGGVGILLFRGVTSGFFPLYVAADVVVIALSMLQSFVFWLSWRR